MVISSLLKLAGKAQAIKASRFALTKQNLMKKISQMMSVEQSALYKATLMAVYLISIKMTQLLLQFSIAQMLKKMELLGK